MQKIEYSAFAPSFSCYTSDGITSTAIAKVIREEDAARIHEIGDVDGEDFEFSLLLIDEEVSAKENDSRDSTDFNRDRPLNHDLDREIRSTDDEIDATSAITGQLGQMFIDKRDESSSCSSSEADDSEIAPKAVITKCEKSNSTGSGSSSGFKKWIFRYLFQRSNSEGKEAMMMLIPTKVNNRKSKRNSGEVLKVQTPVHEQFYVKRRAENEAGKRRSYLPFRKDLVGLFPNVNGMGKLLPF